MPHSYQEINIHHTQNSKNIQLLTNSELLLTVSKVQLRLNHFLK